MGVTAGSMCLWESGSVGEVSVDRARRSLGVHLMEISRVSVCIRQYQSRCRFTCKQKQTKPYPHEAYILAGGKPKDKKA